MKTIILRHDFDWDSGLTDEVRLIFDIERKFNVKSTIFLRYDRGVSELKYKDFYKSLENEGWEFGLHLANHENKPGYDSPQHELETVKKLGLNLIGLSACGGTYHWLDPNGWIVQDNVGLKYMCPSSLEIPVGYSMKSIIAPTHLTMDGGYLWFHGDSGYDKLIHDFTLKLDLNNVLALLSHNTWFYKTIVPKNSPNEKVTNTKYYDRFIQHFIDKKDCQFKTFKEYLNL